MDNILIIGAGAAGSVVAKKCAANRDVFKKIHLASRTLSKCVAVQKGMQERHHRVAGGRRRRRANGQADRGAQARPRHQHGVALSGSVDHGCLPLATGTHYLDTANYEPKDVAKFEYSWQWAYQERFREKGLMAVLGCGFDPGVTNIFCAYAQNNLFDEIHTVDIVDCNDGSHGKSFATNFNPEINIREVTQRGRFWKDGQMIRD